MKKIIALLFPLLVFSSIVMHGSPSYTYDEARPFVRWWWNGDKVEAEELVRELHLFHDQGIGGVEINPIEFPANRDPLGIKALKWLSDEWIDMLRTVFDEAEALGRQGVLHREGPGEIHGPFGFRAQGHICQEGCGRTDVRIPRPFHPVGKTG